MLKFRPCGPERLIAVMIGRVLDDSPVNLYERAPKRREHPQSAAAG